ncbi:MAG: HEPN domain-containing protein [Pyrodictiaceae archaeon]
MIDCAEVRRWLRQATYTLDSARVDASSGFHAWSCFKSHQAAEYALKAVLRGAGVESFGHDLMELWRKAKSLCDGLEPLKECIALLNKMYIPPRYPDAWADGAVPFENYTEKDSRESIGCAENVVRVVKECVVEECENTEEKS